MERYFVANKSFCRPIYDCKDIDNYDVIKAVYVNFSKIRELPSVKSICKACSEMQIKASHLSNYIPYNSNLTLDYFLGPVGPRSASKEAIYKSAVVDPLPLTPLACS